MTISLGAGCVVSMALLGAAFAGNSIAQSYPVKPVRMIVPYPPGGGNDGLGRPFAQKLSEKWGQGVLVENRPGASGMIGADLVAKSAPDGYTLLLCGAPEAALNVTIYPKMSYDPVRNFAPVSQLAFSPLALAVHPSLPVRTPREYIALAKKQPGELAYASIGAGSPQHIAGEWMKMLAGINITHVPYKGGGPQLVDIMGGHVHSGFLALPAVAPHIKSGRVRVIGVTSAKRSPTIPDVPTLGESGLAGYDVSQWYGVTVPAGTPAEIIAKIHADLTDIIKMPDIRSRMADLGAEPVGSNPAQFGEHIRAEIAKYRKIVKDTQISVN
jgi:tripartite-type tricarboxylate transporter receptor subunit TctC